MKKRGLITSFKFAIEGLFYAFKNQRNLRIHIFIGVLVMIVSWLFKISVEEVVVLLFTITLVIICEIINTAVELILDLINGKKYHPLVKVIKDITAAAVLLSSANAVIVGSIIFFKHFLEKGGHK